MWLVNAQIKMLEKGSAYVKGLIGRVSTLSAFYIEINSFDFFD